MSILWRSLVTLVLLHESFSRKFNPGPSVDPGVFVITHISTCRNGAGYCILGFSCEVDKDFTKDDLGGHCSGLGAAFNPKAQFVCCRENPELHPPKPVVQLESTDHEIVIEAASSSTKAPLTSTSVVTEQVTELVTEIIEPVTEIVMVTQINEVTEQILVNQMDEVKAIETATDEVTEQNIVTQIDDITEEILTPVKFLDEELKDDCVTAALLGLDCLKEDDSKNQPKNQPKSQPKKAERLNDEIDSQFVLISTSNSEQEDLGLDVGFGYLVPDFEVDETTILPKESELVTELELQLFDKISISESELSTNGLIQTSPISNLQPDRDDTFESILSNQKQPIIASSTNNAGGITSEEKEEELEMDLKAELRTTEYPQCGKLGGAAVLQAFGRAAHNLLPDLVHAWVTGGQSSKKSPSARLNDDELEPRIIAGDVTSTVLFCWMVAIMEKSKDESESDQFICTGTLVEPDLVVTSASCTLRMFETGVGDFNVVVGDSNLKIDLPFGVQTHEISQVIVHENYRPDDKFHYEDIGLIKLKTNAKMETTVCLLCLPEQFKSYYEENCTVVGYGRPSKAALNQFGRENIDQDLTDGILRKADMPIVDTILCQEFLDVNARSDEMHSGFICAGGKGDEESCYIAMDGGSPLACKKGENHYELGGLVTFGTSCSHDQSPSLFTNVSKHIKWIKENYDIMKRKRTE